MIPLDDDDSWVLAAERWGGFTHEELVVSRCSARSYAHEYMAMNNAVEQNRALFSRQESVITKAD